MNILGKKLRFSRAIFIIVSFALIMMPFTAIADTVSELERQKAAAAAAAAAATAAAKEQQKQASQVKTQISQIDSQIDENTASLTQTNNQINSTQVAINDLVARIKTEEENLATEKVKMNNLINSWYMEGDTGFLTTLLSSDTISAIMDKQEYYDSVKQQIQTSMARIDALKVELNAKKSEQESQLAVLSGLKSSQTAQQKNLENQQWVKYRLLNDTKAMINELEDRADAALAKVAQLQAKINAINATKRWGGDITSANDGSWYYSQLDPAYASTRLGPSPYTVGMYGCLITSLAMVATYYGHNYNPNQAVAASSFSYGGMLLWTSIVNDGGSQAINWDVVDQELANGHPVIVGVALGIDMGNSYGVSHFVVLKPYSQNGNHYSMHDPLGGGRGYSISQVKAMRIIRP